MCMALLGRLGRAPTFLVPIINPPFADISRQPPPSEISPLYEVSPLFPLGGECHTPFFLHNGVE